MGTQLHGAVLGDCPAAARLLVEAAPRAALVRDGSRRTPLEAALLFLRFGVARCLLERPAALPPAADVLRWLTAASGPRWRMPPALFAVLAARQQLGPDEWARMPSPCLGLAAALPAVLARGEAEAALLVALLPAADRQRLRTAALCLRRTERVHGVELPPALLCPLLLAAVERHT